MNPTTFAPINYSQHLNTCVLASYAVACFPFTGTPVLEYFVAYCRHFHLDQSHPERSYEGHFHPLSRTTPGYRVLADLHNGCGEKPFVRARDAVTLGSPVGWPHDTAAEAAIRQPDCVLLMFLNASAVPNLMGMHSIVVGHNFISNTADPAAGIPYGTTRMRLRYHSAHYTTMAGQHLLMRSSLTAYVFWQGQVLGQRCCHGNGCASHNTAAEPDTVLRDGSDLRGWAGRDPVFTAIQH